MSSFFTIIFFFGAKPAGILEAKIDLWRGRYEIHGYGLIFHAPYEFDALNHYGIEYRHVAGCVVNDFIIESVAAYNATMKNAIKKDLNVDVDRILSLYPSR